MSAEPPLTGDPHLDARLEAWRPERGTPDPLDRLPAPGRERRSRIALAILVGVIAALALGYLAIALAPAVAGRP